MKTSLNEIQLIEAHLLGAGPVEDQLLFEAKLVLQPELRQSLYWQEKTYGLLQQYGRQQLRKEIEQVHQTLFTGSMHRSFSQKILSFFRK